MPAEERTKDNIVNLAVNGVNGSPILVRSVNRRINRLPPKKLNQKVGNSNFSDKVHFEDTTCIVLLLNIAQN